MRYNDSVDKITRTYLARLTRQEFKYKNNTYRPKNIVVTKNILRDFKCVAACGACCGNFSLDYLPSEAVMASCSRRQVVIAGSY